MTTLAACFEFMFSTSAALPLLLLLALAIDSAVAKSYIVKLHPHAAVAKSGHFQLNFQQPAAKSASSPAPISIKHEYNIGNFKAIAVELPSTDDQELKAYLAAHPDVETIVEDRAVRINTVVQPVTEHNLWNLARIIHRAPSADQRYLYDPLGGAGVTVYILDTGVRTTHQEFDGRASFGVDYVYDNETQWGDHGTHVAGIIGGRTFGVAKKVSLVSVRILDNEGNGLVSSVAAGPCGMLNAEERPTFSNYEIFDDFVREIIARGVHMTAAAGNNKTDACNDSPAGVQQLTTVGSITSDDELSGFSNSGPCIDLFAPGQSIRSTGSESDTAVVTMSGTSMATPHVTGVMALHLARKKYTVLELQTLLKDTATKDVISTSKMLSGTPNLLLYANPPAHCAPNLGNQNDTVCVDCLERNYCVNGDINFITCPTDAFILPASLASCKGCRAPSCANGLCGTTNATLSVSNSTTNANATSTTCPADGVCFTCLKVRGYESGNLSTTQIALLSVGIAGGSVLFIGVAFWLRRILHLNSRTALPA